MVYFRYHSKPCKIFKLATGQKGTATELAGVTGIPATTLWWRLHRKPLLEVFKDSTMICVAVNEYTSFSEYKRERDHTNSPERRAEYTIKSVHRELERQYYQREKYMERSFFTVDELHSLLGYTPEEFR